eukprot:g81307.t1
MLTHSNFTWNLMQTLPVLNPGDVIAGILPFYHIYGLVLVMSQTIFIGATCLVWPKFDPVSTLESIQKHKITVLHLVPPLVIFLAKHPLVAKYDLSSVRLVVSGAAPLTDEVARQMIERLSTVKEFKQGYGMTEMSPVSHLSPDGNKKYSSAGKLVANTQAKLVSEGKIIKQTGPEHIGELWIKGPQVMKGYLGKPEATQETLTEDGWIKTGDMAYVDEEGYFFVVDRLKELIKYKGFQVPPAELEGILLGHPKIADCAVIPIPDDEAGEIPKAFVVLKAGQEMTAQEVQDFVKKDTAHYKWLRGGDTAHYKWLRGGVEFVETIPKSASGKILRRILKDAENEKRQKALDESFQMSYYRSREDPNRLRTKRLNLISFHLLSSHFISSHLVSSHFNLILSHFILSHLISSHLISSDFISSPFLSLDLVSSRFISYHLMRSSLSLTTMSNHFKLFVLSRF